MATRGRKPGQKSKIIPAVGALEPLTKSPTCPKHLQGAARAAWGRLAKLLIGYRVLTEADWVALELLCQSYGTWREAEQHIADDGMMVAYWYRPEKGQPPVEGIRESPWVKTANDNLRACERLLGRFGMTPADRKHLVGLIDSSPLEPAKSADEQELEKRMGG